MSSLFGSDGDLEDRLVRIEQALKEKEAAEGAFSIPLPLDIAATSRSTPNDQSLSLLTPSTKEQTAKGLLLAGKEQEQRGQLTNALALYENGTFQLPFFAYSFSSSCSL